MALRNRRPRPAKTRALERVEALRREAATERQRDHALQLAREQAGAERKRASEQLTVALTEGGEGEVERKALADAEAKAAQPWPEMLEASRRRVLAAEQAVQRHIGDHFDRVVEEKRSLDEAAHQRVSAAVTELRGALEALEAEAQGCGCRP